MPLAFLALVPSLLLYVAQSHLQINENSATSPVPHNVNSIGDSTMSFEVLQYNVFARPSEVLKDGQSERLKQIPKSLAPIFDTLDVVTFAEAFSTEERNEMLAEFRKQNFSYSTTILGERFGGIVNGGVMIVSKWPIIREAQHVYHDACDDTDCFAAKGVKYARVLKNLTYETKVFNVFATHMQAWSTPTGQAVRIKQATQMRQFVDSIGIPFHEPLIFAGDFNVDKITYRSEVANLFNLLQANEPLQIGEQSYSSDPITNVLVGRDGAARSNKCAEQYVKNWGPLTNNVYHPSVSTRTTCAADSKNKCYCPCCPLEWLDYVLYGKAPYQQPSTVPTLEAYVNKVSPFKAGWATLLKNTYMEMVDLSDHYPVLGKFKFPLTRGQGMDDDPLTYHLDGCSSNSDCKFHILHCKCSGPNCYFHGNKMNGTDFDSNHPVNRNCMYDTASLRCSCGPN